MRTVVHHPDCPECPVCCGAGAIKVRVPSPYPRGTSLSHYWLGDDTVIELDECPKCDGVGRDCCDAPHRLIQISEEFPPIPTRAFDYRATFDGYEGGDPQGFGATPDAAVAELLDQVEA